MTDRDDSLNDDIRDAGFRRCQRVWLTQEQYELVMWMAHQNADEIARIRQARYTSKRDQEDAAWRSR